MGYLHGDVRQGYLFFKPSHEPDWQPNAFEPRPEDMSISAGALLDLTGDIIFGRYVVISRGSQIFTHDHKHQGRAPLLIKNEVVWKNKTIQDDVWIHGAIVLMQCDFIARGTVIGAGAVVTKPITEEYTIWAGNPARKIGER